MTIEVDVSDQEELSQEEIDDIVDHARGTYRAKSGEELNNKDVAITIVRKNDAIAEYIVRGETNFGSNSFNDPVALFPPDGSSSDDDVISIMTEYTKEINKRVKKYIGKVKAKAKQAAIKRGMLIKKWLMENAANLAITMALGYGMHSMRDIMSDVHPSLKPEVFVGGIPLYSVQRIERAMSDRILKYRAIGDVFLAHQRGSLDTLRIDGRFTGPTRNLFLTTLLAFQFIGKSKLSPLSNLTRLGGTASQPADAITGKTYQTHKTFPVVTQTDILLKMFLQTVNWHQDVDEGGNKVIHYHLLFRKHIEPKGYKRISETSTNPKFSISFDGSRTEVQRNERYVNLLWKTIQFTEESMYGFFQGTSEDLLADPYFKGVDNILLNSISNGLTANVEIS